MRGKFKFFLILCIVAIFCEACAPKIYGRRPHRRDRNCGCEYLQPDTLHYGENMATL